MIFSAFEYIWYETGSTIYFDFKSLALEGWQFKGMLKENLLPNTQTDGQITYIKTSRAAKKNHLCWVMIVWKSSRQYFWNSSVTWGLRPV